MKPIPYFDAYTCIGPREAAHPAAPYTLEHLLEEMHHCSIDGALVASTACLRYAPARENPRLSEQLSSHEGLFALWHAIPHWTGECPEPDQLLSQMEASGAARAVLICPALFDWNPLSIEGEPLMKTLEAERVPVIVDAGSQLPLEQIELLAQKHPQLPIIMRGVPWTRGRRTMTLMLHYPNLHLTFDKFQVNYGIEWLIEHGCAERLLFCSNAPDMSMGAHRFYVDYAEADASVRAAVAGGNLTRLLQGQAPSISRVNHEEDIIMAEARRGDPLSVPVIDAHAHMLHEGLNGVGDGLMMLRGGPSGTRELAGKLGVDAIGIMSWDGIKVPDPESGNQCVREAMDAFPDFYWGLATFDPIHDDPETLRRKMEETFRDKRFLGLKPYPSFGLHYDDPRYQSWWEFGNERGLYAGLHPNRRDLSEFDVLCPKYPNMTFVAYHCGHSYKRADAAIDKACKYDNFLAEITLTPVCMGVIDYLVAGCGASKVLYGSDLPMRDPRQQLGWVVYSRLPLPAKKQVLGGNAQCVIDKVRRNQA